jgi:hypothetical protein
MTDAFLWVTDVDRLHDELAARGAVVQLPATNQTWGTRETGFAIQTEACSSLPPDRKTRAEPDPKRYKFAAAASERGIEE